MEKMKVENLRLNPRITNSYYISLLAIEKLQMCNTSKIRSLFLSFDISGFHNDEICTSLSIIHSCCPESRELYMAIGKKENTHFPYKKPVYKKRI